MRPAELIVPGVRVFSSQETLDASHHQWPAAPAQTINYTKVGNYFIRAPDLSLRAKGLLREMKFAICEQPKGTFDLRTGIPYLENPPSENPSTEVPVREFPSTGESGTIITDYIHNRLNE